MKKIVLSVIVALIAITANAQVYVCLLYTSPSPRDRG